jgi:hypothetical protein
MLLGTGLLALGSMGVGSARSGGPEPADRPLFEENFESGLARWLLYGRGAARVVDSGDPSHGRVLALVPQGDAYALIDGSERWGGVRPEGEVLFPSDEDNSMGVT